MKWKMRTYKINFHTSIVKDLRLCSMADFLEDNLFHVLFHDLFHGLVLELRLSRHLDIP